MTFDHSRCTSVVLPAAGILLSVVGATVALATWGTTLRGSTATPGKQAWLLIVVALTTIPAGCQSKTPSSEPQAATLMQLGQATESPQIERLVSALSPTDREQLRQRKQQFESLETEQQQKLREIHQRICGSDTGALYVTLHRYCEWLATLPEGERADILELPNAERIEKIRQRQPDVAIAPFDVMRVVVDWLGQYALRHEAELYRQLPAEVGDRLRERLDRMPKARDKFRTFMLLREVARLRDQIQFPPASREDIEQLISELPEDSVNHLSTRIDFSDPAEVPRELLAMMDSNIRRRFGTINESRLKDFYESDALTTQQRDQLDRLPPEEARLQLQELILLSRMDEMPRVDRRRALDRPPRGTGPFLRRGRPPMGPGGPPGGPRPFPPPQYPPQHAPPPRGEPRNP